MVRRLVVVIALVSAACTAAPDPPPSAAAVALRPIASGMAAPVYLTQPAEGDDRLYVVDQVGIVWMVDGAGNVLAEPFLDISDRIVDLEPAYDERGLLGLAFHPDFPDDGRVFVYYSAPGRDGIPDNWDHTSVIAEFAADADGADETSERVVLEVHQPYGNHNGGQLGFGPDGRLYIPFGDGGNGGDVDAEGDDRGRPEHGWAQEPDTLLGAIVRVDVDADDPYAVPDDNVFVGDDRGPDEVWAYGFRNPYGMSFDLDTGDMYVTDAGQLRYEEVSLVEPGGNHGWNIKEGTHCFDPDNFLVPPDDCPDEGLLGEPLVGPVIEYERGPDTGSVVVPGIRYRGDTIPGLAGDFVFGDYASIRFLPTGILYAATPTADAGELWEVRRLQVQASSDRSAGGDLERFLLGVYQDRDGNLYALTTSRGGPDGTTGEVQLVEAAPPVETSGVARPILIGVAALALVALVAGAIVLRIRGRAPPEGAR